jgi:hypothetical protein
MPALVVRARKHPAADRVKFAEATFAFCRSTRAFDGVESRFYWTGPNSVAIHFQSPGAESLNRIRNCTSEKLVPEVEATRFALCDLADVDNGEWWYEANAGDDVYRAAGRLG